MCFILILMRQRVKNIDNSVLVLELDCAIKRALCGLLLSLGNHKNHAMNRKNGSQKI